MRYLNPIVLLAICVFYFTPAANAGSILVHEATAARASQDTVIAELGRNLTRQELPEATISALDLPFPSTDPVWIATSGQVIECTDPSSVSVLNGAGSFEMKLHRTIELLDAMETVEALEVFSQLAAALPCVSEVVDQETLGRLYFFKGMAEFQLGDRVTAQQSFRISLAIDRGRSWDTSYPPEPQQEFLLAKEAVLDTNQVNLGYSFAGIEATSFHFDGESYDPDKSGVIAVSPGLHLVHYTVDGAAYPRFVELRAGDETALVSRQSLTEAVLAGPYGNRLLAASLISLETLCQTRGYTRAYVADSAEQIYVYENGIYDTLARQLTSDGSIMRPERSASGGLSLTVLGLAYAFSTPYATLNLRGHFKLYQGLELVVSGGTGMYVFEHSSGATALALVPYFSAGCRYRFSQNSVLRPYFGVKALLSFWPGEDDLVMFTIGVAGLGGANFHLSQLFFINLHIEAGYLAGPWISPQAGLGLQF
ncbi:MAG: hypothetical protein ABIG32_00105 [Candidatus Uhrbacteria bacterium]|nr:hypothetical protein [Patescibacteria group bacterium]MBU1906739.1 hypothetical protein [Patescibacteria group bacterium]